MGYSSPADAAKTRMEESVKNAVSSASEFLNPETSGSYEYSDDYMENVQEALALLFKVKRLLK